MPLLVSWAGLIAVLLLAPPEAVPFVGPSKPWGLDKVGHVALFFVLGALAIGPMRARSRRPVLAVFAGSLLYGGLLEVLQGALGWRSAELLDLVADGIGSAGGIAAALLRRPA
jgi:VanZ family protein